MDEVFGKRKTLVVNWRSVTATATKASIPVWFASNEGALAVGDLRRLTTLSNQPPGSRNASRAPLYSGSTVSEPFFSRPYVVSRLLMFGW
jgi:hypothetical protein